MNSNKAYNLKTSKIILKDPNSFDKFTFSLFITLDGDKSENTLERFKNVLFFCLKNSAIGDSNPILYDKLFLEADTY